MTDDDRLLQAWGVSREEILELDPGYLQARADAKREREELLLILGARAGRIAADITARTGVPVRWSFDE